MHEPHGDAIEENERPRDLATDPVLIAFQPKGANPPDGEKSRSDRYPNGTE
jgi:hypothetical protein